MPAPRTGASRLNRHAEVDRLGDDQMAPWRGLPFIWVDAWPEVLTRHIETDRPLLAMLDAGAGVAEIAFARRTLHLDVRAGTMGVFEPARQRYTRWRCRGARRIMVDLDAGMLAARGLVDADVVATPLRQDLEFQDPAIAGLLQAMVQEVAAGCPGGEPAAEGLSLDLLNRVWRRLGRAPARERGRLSRTQLRELDALIDRRMSEPLPLAQLAAHAGYSAPHFTRLLKATVGLAPHRYVVRRRVEKAIELLAGTTLPIAAVAAATGFASQSHLTATLVRLRGVTPAALRR